MNNSDLIVLLERKPVIWPSLRDDGSDGDHSVTNPRPRRHQKKGKLVKAHLRHAEKEIVVAQTLFFQDPFLLVLVIFLFKIFLVCHSFYFPFTSVN